MKILINTLLLLLLAITSLCASNNMRADRQVSAPKVSGLLVTYIGNEGVLISSGDQQVLIDGLHRRYKPDYAFPPDTLLKSLESASLPYDKIRLILVTHVHLDHFHPESVGLHLQNNPQAVLASSEQVAEAIRKDFSGFRHIEPRVQRVSHQWKTKVPLSASGINLKGLGLQHGSPQFSWIQNLGYVVEINGKKLLHIGDADMTEENFSSLGLAEEKIDIAFVPYWYLLSNTGRSIVKNQIRPKHVIAVHISPAEAAQVAKLLNEAYPDAIPLTKILETRTF